MSPQKIASTVRREVPLLRPDDLVRDAVAKILDVGVAALPVVDSDGRLCGVFGEREFMGALFPGYLKTLGFAGFVPRSLDEALEKRASCAMDPVGDYMVTDHIEVEENFSDTELAEIFLHHPVLIIPLVEGGRVTGVVTRRDFFRALGQFLVS